MCLVLGLPWAEACPQSQTKPQKDIAFYHQLPAGPLNAITDVSGVRVGHVTLQKPCPLTGNTLCKPVQTGVTAILPTEQHLLPHLGFPASGVVLHGNGEMTGLAAIETYGVVNGPILLTNTRSVGTVYEGVHQYFAKHFPQLWAIGLPVVGECWDGFFNDIDTNSVQPKDAITAIETAQPGPVAQGKIGAGSGMRSFELRAGIGSASRRIAFGAKHYTLGVLVNTNHSRLNAMQPEIKRYLEDKLGSLEALRDRDNQASWRIKMQTSLDASILGASVQRQGSIMIIIATDLPWLPHQLKILAQHAVLGIAATGSRMSASSGDFALAFSTASPQIMDHFVAPVAAAPPQTLPGKPDLVSDPELQELAYLALREATLEAQLNAILAAHH
jgi:D-aminopeptidase